MRSQRGISLVEIVFAALILGVVAAASMRAFLFMSKQSVAVDRRAFATQKAIQMMEELRGLISDTDSVIGVLDDYDNGGGATGYKYTLSTRAEVNGSLGGGEHVNDKYADPLSGNDDRRFKRRVTVNPHETEPLARRVYVRVYEAATGEVLAETVSVLRTIRNSFYPSHVYDIYVLALENVPGWWVSLSTMRPMFDNIIQDLQIRNPGLIFRTHYITRLAYGRDRYYMPFVNNEIRANNASILPLMQVYLYPGLLDKGGDDFLYYVPDEMGGRRNVDGVFTATTSYSMADQYNHAVRYPDEERMYAQAVAAAQAANATEPEISYRMLLERLATSPGTDSYTGSAYDYRNAIILNMHGELVPLPPLRNYSDPAKDPGTVANANVRVVAHPENLSYSSGSQARLRVYSYVTNPGSWLGNGDPSANLGSMSITIASTQVATSNIFISKAVGNSATATYGWFPANSGTDYNITQLGSSVTVITLLNSPLRHAEAGTNGGLDPSDRLYGLEYIPCLVSSGSAFGAGVRDLTTATNNVPKNTARWLIGLNGLPNGRHTFETRIGDTLSDGFTTKLTNLSQTYVWMGSSAPVTERYQFIGDPRHLPYADVKAAAGYNWFFNNPTSGGTDDGVNAGWSGTAYDGFGDKADRYNSGPNIDVPRFFQIVRTAIMNGNALWSSITGWSSYYVGIGGEMGYDASNGFGDSLPIVSRPWTTSNSNVTTETIQEITTGDGGSDHNRMRVISNTADTWWGLHWLGELYPDSAYTIWTTSGNLPIGAGNYYRRTYGGVGLSNDAIKRTAGPGCATFFNGNSTGGNSNWFMHNPGNAGDATLQTGGSTMAADYSFPLVPTIYSPRPFQLNSTADEPPEWDETVYQNLRTTLSTRELWYKRGSITEDSSAFVRVTYGAQAGGVVMNGLEPQDDFGAAQISKLCVVGMLRGFMLSGEPSVTVSNVPQVPLVTISSPTVTDEFTNPSSINVTWTTAWTRWDGQPYTSNYAGHTPPSVMYNLKVSFDNGQTWVFAGTGVTAKAGVPNSTYAVTTPYTWSTPSFTYPSGNYVIRLECYRTGRSQHYSQHQRRVFIRR